MRTPKEVDLPEELKILNRDLYKDVIVIGSKAYEIEPLSEGELEVMIVDIIETLNKANSPHGQCPKCGKVVENARLTKTFSVLRITRI